MILTPFLPLTPRKSFAGVDRSGRGFNPRPALMALTTRAESFFSPSLAL